MQGRDSVFGAEPWNTTFDDALKADEMFRILMGEKVEPRREFIQKHALEVKKLDYHGA